MHALDDFLVEPREAAAIQLLVHHAVLLDRSEIRPSLRADDLQGGHELRIGHLVRGPKPPGKGPRRCGAPDDLLGGSGAPLARRPAHALEMPTRLVGETREFLWRDEEEIEPISDAVLVPDPEREESGWPTAAHVPLHIGQVVLRPGAGNPAVSDQAPALSGDASKL